MQLEVKSLSFSYGKKEVLKDVSFTLDSGECLFLLGANGVGKSTLFYTLLGLQKAEGITIDGKPIESRSKLIAYVPQDVDFPSVTVFDAVLIGRRPYMKFDFTKEDYDLVEKVLEELSLSDYALRDASTLSGGEKQMVAIARALVQGASILLMDEPTSNLDVKHQLAVLNLVKRLAREKGIAVLLVMHDLSLAYRYGDRFLVLKDGAVLYHGKELTQEHIRQAFDVEAKLLEIDGTHYLILEDL